MGVSEILFIVIAVFAVLGGVDRIFGNKLGLGASFERGFLTMGPLALTMIGMIVLAPVLAKLLAPAVVPVYRWLGADPAMFAGSILACDMGGASLAAEMADDPALADFGGILTSSLLGVTVSFTIPVAMGVISAEDRPYAAKGILCGILTAPLGIFVGGLVAGIPALTVLRNLLPILPLALLIALGLWKFERILIQAFTVFGKLMTALATVGLLLAIVQSLTGWTPVRGLAPLDDAFVVVGEIAVLLAGAFPMMWVITKLLNRILVRVGQRMGMNGTSVGGLLTGMVNSIAMFDTVERMDPRGKVLNMAFAVSASFVFGDHLAFTAGVAPHMLSSLSIGKLTGGISALVVAVWMTRRQSAKGK